jgi:diguanylate cyclase (GGDEF)-like protein
MQNALDEIWLNRLQSRTGFDRNRCRRLYRVILVCAIGVSYAIDTVMLGLFARAGTIDGWLAALYGLAGLGHVVLFSLIHWFGDVDRRDDPHLVGWQMAYSVSLQIIGIVLAPQLTAVFIGTITIVFAFSGLRIPLRRALVSWLLTFVGVGAALTIPQHHALGIVDPSRAEVALMCVSFGLIALRTTLLGYYGSAMRMRLHKVNSVLGQAKRDAEQLAAVDALTGAMTRRAILPLIERTLRRTARSGIPASVAMIDLDWFKSINDRYGHMVGDHVLRRVVERIRECLRTTDAIGRYGGEEFVVLLQGMDERGAIRLIDRVRDAVASADWTDLGAGLEVSISGGIACMSATDTPEGVLARADAALYEAKRGGRNRLCAA